MPSQTFVINRLLNQRARLKPPSPPALTPPPTRPSSWEPDSDAYDTELDEEEEERVLKSSRLGTKVTI